MGKPRRPKRPRFTWNPQLGVEPGTAAPATDTAIPADAVSKATETVVAPSRDAAEPSAPAALPVAAFVPPVTVEPAPNGAVAADPPAKGTSYRPGSDGIGTTIAQYMQGEGEAALAHIRALSQAGSPTELIRLQMGELQRAADASLTCWSAVFRQASRLVAFR